jgi:hypothetical protein
MITFNKLGSYGRLGNQLFQYAFLRTHAYKLETQFYCPPWDGDLIFELNDEIERAPVASVVSAFYDQGLEAGFSESALTIQDGTEMQGYFQSYKYYETVDIVRSWYRFKNEVRAQALAKHTGIDFSNAVSLSLRIDTDYNNTREFFPLYPVEYYEKALANYKNSTQVIVFADRPDLARIFFASLNKRFNLYFIENSTAAEQLYLMTRCGLGNVITNSTFAWWGAYLNANTNATIYAPKEWTRPGVPRPISDITPNEWIHITSLHPILDNFQFWRLRHPLATLQRATNKLAQMYRK